MTFDQARLAAASAVVFSHSFPVLGIPEPLQALGGPTLGTVALWVFFAISGYLVTQSWQREPRLGAFLRKRALRILPAHFTMVAFDILVVGAFFTTLPIHEYWQHSGTMEYLKNLRFEMVYELPGVFENLPAARVVNGSIWSLSGEVVMYGFVAALGVTGGFRYPVAIIGSTFLLWIFADPRYFVCFACFLVGMSLQLRKIYAVQERPRRQNDYSYGLFLYHMPVQQMLVSVIGVEHIKRALGSASPLVFFAWSLLATAPLAIASWHLIEKPALKLRAA